MSKLSFRPATRAFLDPDRIDADSPDHARAYIIPFGLEASVTYGGGTSLGPEAIISASHALEHFDDELWCEPYREFGIATLEMAPPHGTIEDALDQLNDIVGAAIEAGKFPLTLGGEHALTAGAIRPLVKAHDELVIVQFDAHGDLRDGYLGEKFSHAAAMRRALDHDNVSIISFAIRSISSEDVAAFEHFGSRVTTHLMRDKDSWSLDALRKQIAGRPVYISFDVDAFDPSIMPATGTPEPGGLLWDETCRILKTVIEAGNVVGADVVELAPIPGFHGADFMAAKLVYKILSYQFCQARATESTSQL